MTIGIRDLECSSDTHKAYIVDFFDDSIQTTVTNDPDNATKSIYEIERIHRWRLDCLIVGLDVEWRPNNRYYRNPVAILQLCVGRRCLIYQLIHASEIPQSLTVFLSDENYTFVGVGIDSDLGKLQRDHGFGADTNSVDLRGLAAAAYERNDLKNAGLKELAWVVLDKEMAKPHRVTMSRWDYRWLTADQVKYACVDAFVSFEIGRVLGASASASASESSCSY